MPLLFLHFSLQSCSMVPVSALLIFLPLAWSCPPQKAGLIDTHYPSTLDIAKKSQKKCSRDGVFAFRLCHSVVFPQCDHRQCPRVSLRLGDRPAVPWWCVLHWDSQPGVLPLHHLRPDSKKLLLLWHAVWGESLRLTGFRMFPSFTDVYVRCSPQYMPGKDPKYIFLNSIVSNDTLLTIRHQPVNYTFSCVYRAAYLVNHAVFSQR